MCTEILSHKIIIIHRTKTKDVIVKMTVSCEPPLNKRHHDSGSDDKVLFIFWVIVPYLVQYFTEYTYDLFAYKKRKEWKKLSLLIPTGKRRDLYFICYDLPLHYVIPTYSDDAVVLGYCDSNFIIAVDHCLFPLKNIPVKIFVFFFLEKFSVLRKSCKNVSKTILHKVSVKS